MIDVMMDSGRRRGLNSVLSSLSLLCVVLDLQLDGEISLLFFFHTLGFVYMQRISGFVRFPVLSCLGITIVLPMSLDM